MLGEVLLVVMKDHYTEIKYTCNLAIKRVDDRWASVILDTPTLTFDRSKFRISTFL